MSCFRNNGVRFFSFRVYPTSSTDGPCSIDSQTPTRVVVSASTTKGTKWYIHCKGSSKRGCISLQNGPWETMVINNRNPDKVEFFIEENDQQSPLHGTDTFQIEIIRSRRKRPINECEHILQGSGAHSELHPRFSTTADS